MRRLLVLSVGLAAHAHGAQLRAPANVQLTLSFAPLPMLPVSLLSPQFVRPPAAVMKAFHSGDAHAYLNAARAAEYLPPRGDDHQNALYQLGLEREAAERAVRALGRVEEPVARKTAIDYVEFGRQLVRNPGLSADPFRDSRAKRRILKAAGYSRLYGAGGVSISIERAADVRVGRAFANVLRAFKRRKSTR